VTPIPEKMMKRLPTSKFTQANKEVFSEENKACTICMCQYEVDDMFLLLPCLHRFHTECVGEWFKRKNTCPNCKDNVGEHFRREDNESGGGGS